MAAYAESIGSSREIKNKMKMAMRINSGKKGSCGLAMFVLLETNQKMSPSSQTSLGYIRFFISPPLFFSFQSYGQRSIITLADFVGL